MSTESQPSVADALLDYEAAQSYLGGVSRSTIKGLAANGRVERVNIGRRTLFVRGSLDRYIASLQEQRASAVA